MTLDSARTIARIRHPGVDFDTAWRLATTTDRSYLVTCAAEADRNAQDFCERAHAEDGGDALTRRALWEDSKNEATRADTLRAAIDFIDMA